MDKEIKKRKGGIQMKKDKLSVGSIILVTIIGFAVISLVLEALMTDDTLINNIADSLTPIWTSMIYICAIFGMVMFLLALFLQDSITIEQYAIIGLIEYILVIIYFNKRTLTGKKREK